MTKSTTNPTTLMSLLTDTKWPVSYRREDGDLVALFYNPALAPAVQYDRTTGYFSASALAVAAHGIDALIQNDGRMRLIVGCTLNAAEQKAIGKGYDLRAALEERLASIPLEPPDDQSRSALGMLAWMVSQGHLDVKVAVPVDPEGSPTVSTGLYHEKVGVITDRDGNRVSFSGSINETAAGWIHNAESFHVHCSWMGERELEHVEAEVDSFARLWDGKTRSVRVFEFPEALRGKLLEFLPQSDRFVSPPPLQRKELPPPDRYRLMPEEFRRIVWTFLEAAPGLENGIRAGRVHVRRIAMAAPDPDIYRIPEEVAVAVIDRRRSRLGQDDLGGADPPPGATVWLSETYSFAGPEIGSDSVAKRALRKVQSERSDLRRCLSLLEKDRRHVGRRRTFRCAQRMAVAAHCALLELSDAPRGSAKGDHRGASMGSCRSG